MKIKDYQKKKKERKKNHQFLDLQILLQDKK